MVKVLRTHNLPVSRLSFFQTWTAAFPATAVAIIFFGNYTLGADSQVTISQIGATKMACPDMSIEQQLFQLLPKVRSYERNGENLLLKNADGNTSARFLLGEKK